MVKRSRKLVAACGSALLVLVSGTAAAADSQSRAEGLLRQMTLDEKIGQLVQRAGGRQKSLNSKLDESELARVRAGQVGSYLHVAGAEPLAKLQRVAVEEARLHIPLLFAMDVVHGYRTIFPVPLAMASSWKPSSAEQAARVAAIEASAAGLHWTFAPMVDIARDPRWGRVVEGAGEDPYLGARMAEAQINGYQDHDLSRPDTLLATAKHFGAYGAITGGRDYNSADMSPRTLNEVYLPPFFAAAQAGAGSFMTAFNDIGGVPTTANRDLVRVQLRDQWRYPGLIVSDWGAIAELIAHGVATDREAAGVLALNASVDMDMVGGVYEQDLKAIALRDKGTLRLIDAAVLRILRTKESLGLFDRPMQYHDVQREQRVMLAPEHRAAARAVARDSIVLLKNDTRLLPLRTASLKSLAVVGALADDARSALGSWRAQGREEDVVTILQGVKSAAGGALKVTYVAGADPHNDDRSGIDAAVQAAQAADATLLVIGEHYDLSGEARSRSDISLPANQLDLAQRVIATGKPVIVILANGRPLALPWLAEHATTILETWMLGIESGNAVADILFGKYSPAGRLPMTFPRATGEAPLYYAAYPTGRPADPDLTKDTVRYIDQPITPQFVFGHGLSYSEFTYSDLKQSRNSVGPNESIDISAVIANSGAVAADEVVQLYVRDPVASVARPVAELRGFQRIALQPGERKRVTFTLTPDQFAIYDHDSQWHVEAGRIDFMIGASSADVRLRGSFDVSAAKRTALPAAAIATHITVIGSE